MDSFGGMAPVRDDFRCSVCQRKHAFHCEHDTPYRDQILGTYDRGENSMRSSNSQRRPKGKPYHNENNSSVSYANKHSFDPAHNFNLNAEEGYSHERRTDDRYGSITYANPYNYNSKPKEQLKKKNRSCVIL